MSVSALLRPAPFSAARLNALCGALAATMIAALLAGRIGAQLHPAAAGLELVAAGAAIALAGLRFAEVQPIARIFALAAVGAMAALLALRPEAAPRLEQAVLQGTAFSAFLTSLGLIRGPVRRSALVRRAAEALLAFRGRTKTAALLFGAQAMAVLFNIGTIGMLSELAADHGARRGAGEAARAQTAAVTLAALRGTILTTVWNPLGIGFAIVTTAIPTLGAAAFLGLSALSAALVAAGALLAPGSAARPGTAEAAEPAEEPAEEGAAAGRRALAAVLAAVGALIAATVGLHHALGVSFLVAACAMMVLIALLWPRLEPAARGGAGAGGGGGAAAGLGEASAAMASEATVFLAAAVIGAAVSTLLDGLGLARLLEGGSAPMLAVILGCLALIPLAGALLIPHSIVMVTAAQLLGSGPVGAAHPHALALSLCFAWALAISASPISAMSIITGRRLGVPAAQVPFAINRGFTLYGLAAAALLVTATYALE